MKKSINTLEILANFPMTDELAKLVANGMNHDDALKNVNDRVKFVAVGKVVNGKNVNLSQLVDGVQYEQLAENGDTIFKMLRVNDIYILKANKNSKKLVLDKNITTLLECFGCNLLDAKLDDIADESLLRLKVHTQYIPSLSCFTCDTRTSVNQLEKQLNEILVTLLGENAPQVKKSYVRHLKEQYTIANENGYKNGNILVLLQLIVNHAFDCRYSVEYVIKSGLNSHREIKSKKSDVAKVSAKVTEKTA